MEAAMALLNAVGEEFAVKENEIYSKKDLPIYLGPEKSHSSSCSCDCSFDCILLQLEK